MNEFMVMSKKDLLAMFGCNCRKALIIKFTKNERDWTEEDDAVVMNVRTMQEVITTRMAIGTW